MAEFFSVISKSFRSMTEKRVRMDGEKKTSAKNARAQISLAVARAVVNQSLHLLQ